jgi:glycerophosphoryl diester phosphodiesterase
VAVPMIIAHRGWHEPAPENSVAAFRAAADLGVEMVEFDVQATADAKLVVYHDDAVDDVSIASLSLMDLRDRLSPQPPPCLSEVLAALPPSIGLDIELKTVKPLSVVQALPQDRRTVFTTFKSEQLRDLASIAPGTPRGLIIEKRRLEEQQVSADAQTLISLARAASANFLVLDVELAHEQLLRAIADDLGPSYIWAVNGDAEIKRLCALESVSVRGFKTRVHTVE